MRTVVKRTLVASLIVIFCTISFVLLVDGVTSSQKYHHKKTRNQKCEGKMTGVFKLINTDCKGEHHLNF